MWTLSPGKFAMPAGLHPGIILGIESGRLAHRDKDLSPGPLSMQNWQYRWRDLHRSFALHDCSGLAPGLNPRSYA
jgi:hypothetical protein